MNKKLKRNFFTQPTLKVAKDLLGKYIIHKVGGKKIIGKIVETEVYIGQQDKASHAYLPLHLRKSGCEGKKTKRNEAEYLIGGHIYIYLVYGMYWQLNISTYKEGKPECVLIRAVEPITSLKIKNQKSKCKITIQNSKQMEKIANGPGKLCQFLKIDGEHYGLDVCRSKEIYLEDRGEKIKSAQIKAASRIGIDYAGPYWSKIKWRFYIKDNKFVSII